LKKSQIVRCKLKIPQSPTYVLEYKKATGQFLSPICAITGALPIFYICSVNFQKATKNPPTRKCIGITQSLIHAFSSRKWLFCFLSFQTMKLFQTVMIVPAMIAAGKKISQTKKILQTAAMISSSAKSVQIRQRIALIRIINTVIKRKNKIAK